MTKPLTITDDFTIGEKIKGDVEIEVVWINPLPLYPAIEVEVTRSNHFWDERGLKVGTKILLEPASSKNWWIIKDRNLPWFILSNDQGKKSFCFYH